MTKPKRTFYGKYRGQVFDNEDPQLLGRLQAFVTDVLGETPTTWALPCLPMAGTGTPMGVFCVPPIGAGVWIEFEHGDPDKPIWSGCWYSEGMQPVLAPLSPPPVSQMVIQTQLGTTLSLSDLPAPPGGILLKTPGGAMISVSDTTGILISDGKGATITVTSPAVSINNGALVVTMP
jgi:Type VI secretion system/phage-baseplate injector OB domain